MADHFGHLKRADSTQSLASLAGDRKYNKSGGGGALKLDINFAPPGPREKKSVGAIHIKIEEGKQLSTTDPYVKLYLSKDGKDVKGTKQKTKAVHKRDSPVYGDRFVYHLKAKTALDATSRLQITVWSDGGKMGKNECCGAMSFTLEELVAGPKVGWFGLLPEWQGRDRNSFLSNEPELDPMLIPEPFVGPPPSPSPSPSLRRSGSRKASRKEKKAAEKAAVANSAAAQSTDGMLAVPNSLENSGRFDTAPDISRFGTSTAAPDVSRFAAAPAGGPGRKPLPQLPQSANERPTRALPTPAREVETESAYVAPAAIRSAPSRDDEDTLPPTPQESPAVGDDYAPPPGQLQRSNSQISLASVAQADVVSADVISGQVFLEVTAKDRHSSRPAVHVKVIKAQHLQMTEPYIKMYLSKLGNDIKSTKKKTKRVKKDKTAEVCNPVYMEDFEYGLAAQFRPIENFRLQISVWDHGRRRANICHGGFSFALQELFDRGSATGWFDLLPYAEGRNRYLSAAAAPLAEPEDEPVAPVTAAAAATAAVKVPSQASTKDDAPVSQASTRKSRKLPVPTNKGLTRSESQESLASIASATIVSGEVEGDVHLYLKYEAMAGGKKGVYGKVSVTVNEGRDLSAKDPYVKLYLSKDGSNVKSSKKKTRVQRKSKSPVFQEQFDYELNDKTPLESTRLQITVWDHSRSRANECTGGMSFAITELANTPRTSGWFRLLPYKEGRAANDPCAGRIEAQDGLQAATALEAKLAAQPSSAEKAAVSTGSAAAAMDGGKKSSRKSATSTTKSKKKGLAVMKQRDEDHVREKADLHEKIQVYREQVEQMASLQSRNLRLQNDVADTKAAYEQLELEKTELEDRLDELVTQNKRLNEFIILHKDDAEQRRDEIVVLRDCLSDQKDENTGLRSFIIELQTELLKIDRKAFARALAAHQSSML